MSLHSDQENIEMAKIIIRELIAFDNKCRNNEFTDNIIKCEELAKTVALARIVGADLGE